MNKRNLQKSDKNSQACSKELFSVFPDILLNEPLIKYSTYRIGGPADYLLKANTTDQIIKSVEIAQKHQIPFIIIGQGANVLFHDNGFRGLIIKNETNNFQISPRTREITADSGVLVAQLLYTTINKGIFGLEKWLGLPGTVGAAVRGNAGCNGLETKDIITKAIILDPKTAKFKEVDNNYFKFNYRHSILKENREILLSATFRLPENTLSKEQSDKILYNIREFRLKKQPVGPSSGSFFKNPSTEKPAGLLIDQTGLKGKTHNKAQISEKHANFILNLGGATQKDILFLAKLAKQQVQAKFGITLQEEVQIYSETGATHL